MTEFKTINGVFTEIKKKLNSVTKNKKILLLYAFNGIGKTRLSNKFNKLNENESDKIKVLCYNAFLEDLFKWDNENCILSLESTSWELKIIESEGLNSKIIDNFKNMLNTKIEPDINLETGEIIFKIPSDETQTNIKISRGEESIFIWSVFSAILENVISQLEIKKENRSTHLFDDLEYIIIDDPVSSIDDNKLITLAIDIIEIMNSYKENNLKFLLTTHHTLFYSIFYNTLIHDSKNYNLYPNILSKNNFILKLEKQKNTPFGYHLLVIDEIQNVINSGNIKKFHFNLFRTLLEKTSNFLGYTNWEDCIAIDKKEEFITLLNLHSHNGTSDTEFKELSDESKDLFKEVFNTFIKEYKWSVQ